MSVWLPPWERDQAGKAEYLGRFGKVAFPFRLVDGWTSARSTPCLYVIGTSGLDMILNWMQLDSTMIGFIMKTKKTTSIYTRYTHAMTK